MSGLMSDVEYIVFVGGRQDGSWGLGGGTQRLDLYGSLNWTRTSDLMINSHLLYQLSYQGMIGNEVAY